MATCTLKYKGRAQRSSSSAAAAAEAWAQPQAAARAVSHLAKDRVFASFYETLSSTLRTN